MTTLEKMNKALLMLFALGLLLSGCSQAPVQDNDMTGDLKGYPVVVPLSRQAIAWHIQDRYQHLRGIPYRMGGNDSNGFDCSGLSRHIFGSLADLHLPRTTFAQSRIGQHIDRSQLQAGDLVFFRPPSYPRHVGVYLGAGEFVHASSSQGVTISRLDTNYWRRHYWMGRRIVVPANET